jgi:hypothetical protein
MDDPTYYRCVNRTHTEPQARLLAIDAPQHLRLVQKLARVLDPLQGSAPDQAWKQAARLSDCRRSPALYQSETGRYVVSKKCCNTRLCPACGRAKLARLREEAAAIVERMDSPKFVTLTVLSTPEYLAVRLKHLRDSFARLRRHKTWRRNYTRGVAVVEVTFNPKSGQWHPHLHLIVDGQYVQQHVLSRLWEVATGDSRIVHIRAVPKRSDAIRYVTKYAQKAADLETIPDERVPEFLAAMRGLRTHSLFGPGCRRIIKRPERPALGKLSAITQLADLHRECRAGTPGARDLLRLVYLAARRKLPRAAAGALVEPEDLDRQIAELLRPWLDARTNHHGYADPEKPRHPPPKRSDDRRAVRLWEESNAPLVGLID